jgi:[acyl-carrier-protein] S-malonyltransferase
MKAFVFPGQGAQYAGMGKDLFEQSPKAKEMFNKANSILKFKITDLMFDGTEDDLKQTNVTQPAVFLHSVILANVIGDAFKPDMVAGHSLGEFSALVANKTLSFEDGLKLVAKRAAAMQSACEVEPSTMAAIIGLEDEVVEKICKDIKEIVVPANYNSPGQLVISGSIKGVEQAIEKCNEAGAKRALMLKVGGAFHSPLMEPAGVELAKDINTT